MARRRVIAIGAAVAVAIAVAVIAGSTATAGAAGAVTTVGAGSYTTDPVGPLPSGCGTVSTHPRQFVTAHAPTRAILTNDWWSSLVFKRLNCQYSENLAAHPMSFLPNANGLGFSYSTTAFTPPRPNSSRPRRDCRSTTTPMRRTSRPGSAG